MGEQPKTLPTFPDGYGFVPHQQQWYVVKALFYSSGMAYQRLRGTLCSVNMVLNERGTPRQFQTLDDAIAWCESNPAS